MATSSRSGARSGRAAIGSRATSSLSLISIRQRRHWRSAPGCCHSDRQDTVCSFSSPTPSTMDFAAFKRSLGSDEPPTGIAPAILGLWWDAKGNWERAHEAAQEREDGPGCWVHAYLHRKEGDLENAAYWYRRAGRTAPDIALSKEWERIALALLEGASWQPRAG